MTNYGKGTRIERIFKKFYEVAGCTVVRSAGSHGAVDLVVFKPDGVMLIQCKKTANGGHAQYAEDVRKLAEITTGGTVVKWLYVLRTKGKVVDMYMVDNHGIVASMRMDWKGILKVANDG